MGKKMRLALVELAHHLPYSMFGVVLSIILVSILTFIAQVAGSEAVFSRATGELFHVFHPTHVLLSAVATTAMFWKHDNHNVLKAVLIGFVGSVSICGISDIILPFIGGRLLGYDMHIHVCMIEEPMLVFPFAILGVFAGLAVTRSLEKSTEYSHSVHVFLSSTASLLYLISFGLTDWMHAMAGVFFVTLVAVVLPCCFSDIVFPMVCTHRYCGHSPDDILHKH